LASESKLARLPFLSWSAGTAAQVAIDIEQQFNEAVLASGGRLRNEFGVDSINVRQSDGELEITYKVGKDQHTEISTAIIYAVGFGLETGSDDAQYWRNDCLGQSEAYFSGGARIRRLVSGVGDGALIDMLRLTFRDFSQDTVLAEVFGSSDDVLVAALRQIRGTLPKQPIYDSLRTLETMQQPALMKLAIDRFRAKARTDTEIFLNGELPSFREALNNAHVSFGNSALAYCAHRTGAFTYLSGRIDRTKRSGQLLLKDDAGQPHRFGNKTPKILYRHGADRETALLKVGLDKIAIDHLKSRSEDDTGQPVYPPGWWGRSAGASQRVEHVPPALMMQATTFVSTLADLLRFMIDRRAASGTKHNFRVALHRLASFDGQQYFQQITRYFGRIDKTAGVGRIFPLNGGIVGLACRTGSLVVVRRTSEDQFQKVWKLAEFDSVGARAILPYVDSLLACPFFSIPLAGDRVAMVLFVDSSDPDFFDDDVLAAISIACKGFVDLLETSAASGAIRAVPTSYSGFQVHDWDDNLIQQLEHLGVRFTKPNEHAWKDGLTFKSLRSLDLELGRLAQSITAS
jgi:hypothetical protein